jgi:uncharacterized membrane protein
MTDNTTHTTPNDSTVTSAYNVISVAFDDDSNAYTALTALKQLETQGRLSAEGAAVVARGGDGEIEVKDQVGSSDELVGTVSGGTLGLLIGILGGPLGVLLGGSYGLLVGSAFDLGEADATESVLSQISGSVRPGRTALLAQVNEQSPEIVDTAMAGLGGTVLRRPVDEVEAEMAAAEKAEREAKREANKELMRGRREHTKEQAQTKVQELKAKLSHRDKTATAGS